MLFRPDSHSFTKFIVSAGVFFVIAAFVIPGLILRDTGILTIPRRDLRELTPTARSEVERRQSIAHFAGHLAPYLAGALLVGGVLLIAVGVPRLKEQEETADAHARAELDKLRREMQAQTEEERNQRTEAKIKEEKEVGGQVSSRSPTPGASQTPQRYLAGRKQLQISAESAVIGRINEILPAEYELQTKVKFDATVGRPLLLDALLISRVGRLPDIVVEIKLGSEPALLRNVGNRLAEAESQLLRYSTRYQRDSIAWLILYTEKELDDDRRKKVESRAGDLDEIIKISVISPDSLDRLTLPI